MSNNPVLIGMIKGKSTYFVTAYSYVDMEIGKSVQIYIHDPAIQKDYTNLDTYFNEGWSINRLYVYS